MLLNGWQRIQRADGNHNPAFGTQISFKPNNKFFINWSTFIGSDQPDSVRRMRYFNNLYTIAQLNGNIALTAGLDVGIEQKSRNSSSLNLWYTPVGILRIKLTNTKHVALRAEHYQDKANVIISKINSSEFGIWSYSTNFDWNVNQDVLWRIETKLMQASNPVFLRRDGRYDRSNWTAAMALCFSF